MSNYTDWETLYRKEYAVINQLWELLGITTYQQAGGKSICELLGDKLTAHDEASDALRACLPHVSGALEVRVLRVIKKMEG